MPRVRLGEQGPAVSRLVAGTWRLMQQTHGVADQVEAYIETCIGLGVTTFDHADVYGGHRCEEVFGSVLRRRPELRRSIEIVTKCGITLPSSRRWPENRLLQYNSSGDYIVAAVQHSLKALCTDVIDVLLIHRPDPLMDADDVARAFDRLRRNGSVRFFGVSNFSPSQFDLLQSRLDVPLVTHQIELSALETKALHDGSVDQCQTHRIPVMAWSPLGGGRLFSDGEGASALRLLLSAIASRYQGADAASIALAWLLRHPASIIPILGTTSKERLTRAVAACRMVLDREDWYAIYMAAGNKVV